MKCDGGQKDEGHRPDAVLTNLPNTSSSEREGMSGRSEEVVSGRGGWRKMEGGGEGKKDGREMGGADGEKKEKRRMGGSKGKRERERVMIDSMT